MKTMFIKPMLTAVLLAAIALNLNGCATIDQAIDKITTAAEPVAKHAGAAVKKVITDLSKGKDGKIGQTIDKGFAATGRQLLKIFYESGLDDYINEHVGKHETGRTPPPSGGGQPPATDNAPPTTVAITPNTKKARQYSSLVSAAAKRYRIPTGRIYAVIHVESYFNPKAGSHAGAQGLMQLMPPTAKSLGVTNSFDPAQNIDGGSKYLAMLYAKYNNWQLAHAAYNAGPGNVKKYGNRVPPFKETQNYVVRTASAYESYKNLVLADARTATDKG